MHPVAETRQTLICYDKTTNQNPNDFHNASSNNRRPVTPPPSNTCYPLAPNICVEAGRIQFVRRETDGAQVSQQPPPLTPVDERRNTNTNGSRLSHNSTTAAQPVQAQQCRVTVTRGLQTEWLEDDDEANLREIQVGGSGGCFRRILQELLFIFLFLSIKNLTLLNSTLC